MANVSDIQNKARLILVELRANPATQDAAGLLSAAVELLAEHDAKLRRLEDRLSRVER